MRENAATSARLVDARGSAVGGQAPDQPVTAIGADVVLVARRWDRRIDPRRVARAGFALVVLTVQRASHALQGRRPEVVARGRVSP